MQNQKVHKFSDCFIFTLHGENDDLQDEVTILNEITMVQIVLRGFTNFEWFMYEGTNSSKTSFILIFQK